MNILAVSRVNCRKRIDRNFGTTHADLFGSSDRHPILGKLDGLAYIVT